ncbi:hypothetical protein [Facklamia sp. P12950]|uniref:hypothetical protein n=1 Tax=Facklamia sp. P12950 TaxID=3421951 RepID=UPI003D18237B
MRVSIDNMADEIMKGLEEYSDMAADEVKKKLEKLPTILRKTFKQMHLLVRQVNILSPGP